MTPLQRRFFFSLQVLHMDAILIADFILHVVYAPLLMRGLVADFEGGGKTLPRVFITWRGTIISQAWWHLTWFPRKPHVYY